MLEHLANPSGTVVARARVGARTAARQRVELLCGRVAFRPPGLHPSAILIVRSLRCRVREHDLGALEPRMVAGVERGVQATLGAATRDAAHPARGESAENAPAVCFEDLAQLVECLARDWLSGCVALRWWWRPVLKGLPAARVVHEFCREHPELVPAILERLAKTSHAAGFAASFTPGEAASLTGEVARAFGVPDITRHWTTAANAPELEAAPPSPFQTRLRVAHTKWTRSGLAKPAAELLALAVALRGSTTLDRSHGISQATATVHAAIDRTHRARVTSEASHVEIAHASPADDRKIARPELHDTRFISEPERLSPSRQSDDPRGAPVEADTLSPRAVMQGANRTVEHSPLARVRPEEAVAAAEPATRAMRAPEANGVEAAPLWRGCQTAFGGIFYVLNAALHMGYYGDFTQPRTRGLAVSPWDFLAVCGRTWFRRRFVADPAWRLLASLAGRDADEEPDAAFDPDCMLRTQERIALALGEKRPRRAISRLVLADARVTDTGTHLDVHLALDKLPLCVRYAGLDRDPGWIPAAGRIVAFHFD